jgi:hypothetical protein
MVEKTAPTFSWPDYWAHDRRGTTFASNKRRHAPRAAHVAEQILKALGEHRAAVFAGSPEPKPTMSNALRCTGSKSARDISKHHLKAELSKS